MELEGISSGFLVRPQPAPSVSGPRNCPVWAQEYYCWARSLVALQELQDFTKELEVLFFKQDEMGGIFL